MSIRYHVLLIIYVLYIAACVNCRHLKGTWRTSDFLRFLAKFGFQRTDPGKLQDTQGFIYGNITSRLKTDSVYTLVLVSSEYFVEFYGNRSFMNCNRMFHKIDSLAFDADCKPEGTEDFLRKIPCKTNTFCIDEDNAINVLPGRQFTFRVQNSETPRFWYLSMVACQRKNCNWIHNSSINMDIDYDIWMVNGDPASKHLNPFEHQFSFEMQDVVEIYAIFSVLYTVILPFWIYAYQKQIHPITKLLTVCICTEYAGVVMNVFHVLIYSFNGVGAEWLKVLGNVFGIFAECFFVLLLLLIAKGWTITSMKLTNRKIVFVFWGIYTVLTAILFIIGLTKVDDIKNIDEWNGWPVYFIITFRMVVMVWFIVELRATVQKNKHPDRLEFFQQFAAYYLVWFIYLPILVIVATLISALWRYKTILSITYAADLLSFIVLIHLLWPSRSVLYLIKGDMPLPQYDLEAAGLIDTDEAEEISFETQSMVHGMDPNTQESSLGSIREEETSYSGSTDNNTKSIHVEGNACTASSTINTNKTNSGHVHEHVSVTDNEEDFEMV